MKTPKLKLVPIDLSKAKEHKHPDIVVGTQDYLVLYNDRFYAGRFSQQRYGLNFDNAIYPTGCQFDAPGWNHSLWQAIWKIEKETEQ